MSQDHTHHDAGHPGPNPPGVNQPDTNPPAASQPGHPPQADRVQASHGSSIFAFGRRLRLDADLHEMRNQYRHDATGQVYTRYLVAIVVAAEATGSQPVTLERCYLRASNGKRVELAHFENGGARINPGNGPMRIALDAAQLWHHGAQRVDLVDDRGHRWSVHKRKLHKLMRAYEDHAATVDQMNAAEAFTRTWRHDEPEVAPE